MHVTLIVSKVLGALLLPPASLILMCATGMLLRRSYPRFGMLLSAGALLILTALSTEVGALLVAAPLEQRVAPLASVVDTGAQAIVVLGGGRLANAPEYGGTDIANYLTLARLRYGAKLQHQTGLPLLVTGGAPDGSPESEAAGMARALREDFATPVKWLEEASDNTAENAKFSAAILKQAGVKKIILVTDAMHMPRSQMMFAQAGLEVVAAPTIFFSRDRISLLSFLPSGEGLRRSHYALHEWLGLIAYRARH